MNHKLLLQLSAQGDACLEFSHACFLTKLLMFASSKLGVVSIAYSWVVVIVWFINWVCSKLEVVKNIDAYFYDNMAFLWCRYPDSRIIEIEEPAIMLMTWWLTFVLIFSEGFAGHQEQFDRSHWESEWLGSGRPMYINLDRGFLLQ